MLLNKIEIENFRSIKNLTLKLHKKTVFVGKNNTGKSNILRAIDLVLGEKYPKISKEDFYDRDETNDIRILVEFAEVTDQEVEDIKNNLIYDSYNNAKNELEITRKIKIEYTIGLGGQNKKLIFGDDVYYKYFSKQLKDVMLSSVYIPAIRDHNKILKVTEYSLFNKMLNEVYSNADRSEKDELEAALLDAAEKCKNIFNESESKLNELTNSIIKHNGLKFSLLPSNRQNIYKKMSLLLDDGIESELEFKGSGIQSAVIISMFKLYADLKIGSAILLIEEPESFLHPHANRHMAKVLNSISKEEGLQVIFTTHSPYYLTDSEFDGITLVKKSGSETVKCQPSFEGINKTKLRKEMDVNNLELFFADKVVLVEGETEKILLPYLSPKINSDYDFDRNNISIIDVGSKSNFLIYLKLLKTYEIECYLIIDNDILDSNSNTNLTDIADFLEVNIDNLSKNEIITMFKSKNIHILSLGEIENYYSKSWFFKFLEEIIKDIEMIPSSKNDEIIEIFRRFTDPSNLIEIRRDMGRNYRDYYNKIDPIFKIKEQLMQLDFNLPKVSDSLKSILKAIDLNSKPRIAIKIKDHIDMDQMGELEKNELIEIITNFFQGTN